MCNNIDDCVIASQSIVLYSTVWTSLPSGTLPPADLHAAHAGQLTSQLPAGYIPPQCSVPFYEDYWQNSLLVPSSTEVNRGTM